MNAWTPNTGLNLNGKPLVKHPDGRMGVIVKNHVQILSQDGKLLDTDPNIQNWQITFETYNAKIHSKST